MINPELKTIENLFNNYDFKVPNYQRAYEWKRQAEIDDFWLDLFDYYEKKIADPDTFESLFLGSIILYKLPNKRTSYEIVDGQQRITTLFILLIAVRNKLNEFVEKGIEATFKNNILNFRKINDSIETKIAFFDSSIGSISGTRLEPSSRIKDVFQEMCRPEWRGVFEPKIGRKQVKSQNKILKPIYDYFYSSLDDVKPDYIPNLIKSINDIRLITVEIDEIQEAFLLFERTNARGRDLEVADLLKNHLFMNLLENLDETEERWNNITNNAGNGMIRMLKYFYVSQKGYIKNSDLYKSLKNYSDGDTEKLLSEIEKFSVFYKLMRECKTHHEIVEYLNSTFSEKQSHNEDRAFYIYQAIDGLRLFNITQIYPLLYSFLNAFFRLQLEADERHKKSIAKFFESLENYHFINNFICDRIGNEVEKLYAEFSSLFASSETAIAFERNMADFYSELRKKLAYKSEFIERFSELAYGSRNIKDLMYIFDRFNNVDSKGNRLQKSNWHNIYNNEVKYSRGSSNIEHWFPQSPKEKSLQDESTADNIGNLIVIPSGTNGKLGNKTPFEKYIFLQKNPELDRYPFNKVFIEKYAPFDNWGDDDIKKRAIEMAVFAYDSIWHFNPPVLSQHV